MNICIHLISTKTHSFLATVLHLLGYYLQVSSMRCEFSRKYKSIFEFPINSLVHYDPEQTFKIFNYILEKICIETRTIQKNVIFFYFLVILFYFYLSPNLNVINQCLLPFHFDGGVKYRQWYAMLLLYYKCVQLNIHIWSEYASQVKFCFQHWKSYEKK